MISCIFVLPVIGQPLSGTKVIGSGGDYATFTAAVNALVTNGVSGPVIFNVKTGSYNEQISIGAISGTSSTNTVTFRAQSLNSADVTLYYTPTVTNNYVVDLNGANYVTFRELTIMSQTSPSYGIVVHLRGNADHNTINNCTLNGIAGASSYNFAVIAVDGHSVDNFDVDSNAINDGGYGIYFDGFSNADHSDGIQFTNNTTSNTYYGVWMRYADDAMVTNNTINNSTGSGIILSYCYNEFNITKNRITGPTSNGIYLYICIGGTGFPSGPGLVANNFVQCPGGNGINIYSCNNQNIYYNSVNMTGGSSYGYWGYNNTDVVVQNNIFANTGGGYAVYFYNATGATTMDYNNLYTIGNFIGLWGSTATIDLDSWRTISGKDANSVSYYPGFTSATNLKTASPWLNGRALVFADVTDDIEGNARNGSTPDIGADEYDPSVGSMTPLSGAYTIGSGGTYATFKLAVADLLLKGVSAPVTFNVLTGTYSEHIVLYNIPGANTTNTVTFQANTGNPANATLYFFAAAAESNYVVSMYNADYIRFRKMSLRSNNNVGAQYGRVFYLYGNTDNFTLDSCIVSGTPDANSSANYIVIYTTNSICRNTTINGNTFNDGGYVVYLDGYNAGFLSTNTIITNNTLNNPDHAGVFLQYHDVPMVNGNTITNPQYFGIQINYGYNNMQVLKNKITGAGSYGIYLYNCIGGTGFPSGPGLMANNFVQCGGAYGIDIYSCSNQNIYYNSVNMTAGGSYAYYGYNNSTEVVVRNNIFANTGGGYAVYFANANGATTMDYNNLYSVGNFIGLWGSTATIDLDSWRTTSGKDANSVSYYPGFTTATNLKTASPWLNGRATVFADVTDDIEGNARDGSTPDIGADEYDPSVGSMTPLSGAYTIGSGGTYATFKLAVADLQLKGVSGPVTFNVLTGTYNEHIILYNIPGANTTNTITFQANTGNPANATLYYFAVAAESNYVVSMYNADYIRFRKMSLRANNNVGAQYGRIFYLYGNTDNFTLDSCIVYGTPTASSSSYYTVIYTTNSICRNTMINGNTFNDGGYVVYMDGFNASFLSPNTVITNNTFNNPDYIGVFLQYHDLPMINGNTITNPSYMGIGIYYGYNNVQVMKNKITGAGNYGIYLYNCIGGTGFPSGPGLVANNFIQCPGGFGIDIYSCSNQNIYYNSVNVTVGGSYAYYGYNNSTEVVVRNNIFANTGGGYAVYFANANGATTMDYNNLYTIGNFIGLYGSTATVDLDAWRAISGMDANSVSYYPGFTSSTNLRTASPWLNGRALVFADVTDDVDGNARDGSTPDIGAYEYDPDPGTITPLSGVYTIGSGGTYATFKLAVADLLLKGVGGPVTFNVLTGMYNEHIVLYNIPGASATNTITFQSQNGNPNGTTLYYPATVADSNYVIQMYQADFFIFKNLTLRANTSISANYGRIFNLYGNVDHLRIEGNVLEGTPGSSSSGTFTIVNSNQAVLRSLNIVGNTINDGGFAIYIDGYNSTFPCDSTVILGNIFNNPDYTGIYMQYHNAPIVESNMIVNPTFRGIELNTCNNGVQVKKNKIYNCGNFGIYLYSCIGGVSGSYLPGLVANNFIHGIAGSYGIDINTCANQKIYHNSVHIISSNTSAYYGYNNTTNVEVKNNIFANSGGGYAVYFTGSNGATAMDYNDHFTNGTYLGYYGSTYIANLTDWQTASGMDGFSISVNPPFYSATNLHVSSAFLDSTGTPVAEVTDDFDGEPRNPVKPDIGADEFSLIIQSVNEMESGWNMISLPVLVTDNRKTTLYPTAGSDAFAYLPSGYAPEDSIEIGVGYWMKYPSGQQNTISGYPKLIDTIDVLSGWNMIGAIAYPIPTSAIVLNTSVISDYFGYSSASGYISVDTLEPGKAYWVKTSAAGAFILDVNNTKLKSSAVTRSELLLDQLNRLTFGPVGSKGSDVLGTKLYFGTVREKEIDLDRFSLPPLPPEGVTDVRFASGRFVELLEGENTQDRRIPISIQGNNVTIQLSWDMKQQSRIFNLVERNGERIISKRLMDQTGSMTIRSNGKNTFTIESEPLPSKITLYQNYPNPFNPSTTIRFALPAASPVTVKVYDLLGQEVATLVNEVRPAGEHSVTFDASALSSGIYFYQLRVNNFIESKKLMLVK